MKSFSWQWSRFYQSALLLLRSSFLSSTAWPNSLQFINLLLKRKIASLTCLHFISLIHKANVQLPYAWNQYHLTSQLRITVYQHFTLWQSWEIPLLPLENLSKPCCKQCIVLCKRKISRGKLKLLYLDF